MAILNLACKLLCHLSTVGKSDIKQNTVCYVVTLLNADITMVRSCSFCKAPDTPAARRSGLTFHRCVCGAMFTGFTVMVNRDVCVIRKED